MIRSKKYKTIDLSRFRNVRLLFYCILFFYCFASLLNASGGYDNGTSTGKGKIGLDLTWNPFNYWSEGQSYAVLSYGFTHNFDIHGYYSIPSKGSDNYYLGFFYQFFKHKYLDLATAIGIRQYRSKSEKHLFAPQLLYTLHPLQSIRIGGSFVTIRNIDEKNKLIGTTIDIALIIPIVKSEKLTGRINSIDFAIGTFQPILWKPDKGSWHPTYSIDIKLLY